MEKIVIIDDKTHALDQIKASIPNAYLSKFEIYHFDSFKSYEMSNIKPCIVFLDFFLDKDKKPGTEILKFIDSEYLIGFSSKKIGSDIISTQAAKINKWPLDKIYSVKKIKEQLYNENIKLLFENFIKKNDFESKIKVCQQELQSEESINRYEAIIILGQSIDALEIYPPYLFYDWLHNYLLNDPNDHVRFYAAQALGYLDFTSSIHILEKAKQLVGLKEFRFDDCTEETSKSIISAEIDKSISKLTSIIEHFG